VLIGPNVQIYTAIHPLKAGERLVPDPQRGQRYLTRALPVTIGDDAWIGGGAILLPGVNIGRGAVIGAGAVVTKNVPDHALALGNPCRVVRENLES
jgi:maltose O-acetyltransferase